MDERLNILSRYNIWGLNAIDFGFARLEYTNKIEDYVGNRLVKVLIGQRRTGKSYLMRQLLKYLVDNGVDPKNTLMINRELTAFEFLKTYKDLEDLVNLYRKELHPSGRIYIFIDEIQLIEDWEKAVNSYSQDYVSEYELFISGSNSKLLSGELATFLSGRYVEFMIYPLSYTEYLEVENLALGRESYGAYLNTGGLPELFSLPDKLEIRQNYMASVRDSVLLKDIIQRHQIRDPKLLDDIFSFLVNNASNLVSVSGIVNYFKGKNRKTSYDAVSAYIGYEQIQEIEKLLIQQRNNAEWWKKNIASHTIVSDSIDITDINPNYWVYGVLCNIEKKKAIQYFRNLGYNASGVHLPNTYYSIFSQQSPLKGVVEFYKHFIALPSGWWVNLSQKK